MPQDTVRAAKGPQNPSSQAPGLTKSPYDIYTVNAGKWYDYKD